MNVNDPDIRVKGSAKGIFGQKIKIKTKAVVAFGCFLNLVFVLPLFGIL